jgi:HSP20 family protein
MKNGKKGGQKQPREQSPDEGGNPFDDFLEDFAADKSQPLKFLRAFMAGEDSYNPAVDVVEEKDKLVLMADLPGVAEKDLKIEFVEGGVILRGSRSAAPEGQGSKLRRAERPAGEFTKSVPLPRGLDTAHAKARIESGVLTLTIPRAEKPAERVLKAGDES